MRSSEKNVFVPIVSFFLVYAILGIEKQGEKNKIMPYYNYHAKAKRPIAEGKLVGYYYTENHNGISPALVLVFDDFVHPYMPIREYRWGEYEKILPTDKLIERKNDDF